jgi:protocatechuate 3,4-dioxygenase beta subunit
VKVYLDGNLIGTPTVVARPDVASALRNSAYTNSGYRLTYSAASLSVGTHSVTAIAIDSGARSTSFGPLTFTVSAAPPASPPFGNLESATDSVTGGTTVSTTDSLFVQGWVADATDGAPVSNVKVYLDGNLIGTPTVVARPDVASAFNNSAYTNSGYRLTYSAASLSVGSHSVTAIAIDSSGHSTTFGPVMITVSSAPPPSPPFGNLESATDSVTGGTTVSKSDSLFVQGWVADATDGAPLSNVKVYLDGNLIGTPTAVARPDVASAFNNSAYTNSGYRLTYSAASLSVGTHSVTAIAIDSAARSTTFGPLTFAVTSP